LIPLVEPDEGELSKNLQFFAWFDDGENVWESGEEPLLDKEGWHIVLLNKVYPLAISPTLVGGDTSYIGLAWCAGTMTIETDNTITCNGESMGNDNQTDSMMFDVNFYIEQARNNPNFSCNEEILSNFIKPE
jgi:hypothetical protein